MHTTINSKGQITIPAKIRKQLGIKDNGAYLHIEANMTTKQIVLTSITREYIHSFRGKYKGMGLMKSFMKEKNESR